MFIMCKAHTKCLNDTSSNSTGSFGSCINSCLGWWVLVVLKKIRKLMRRNMLDEAHRSSKWQRGDSKPHLSVLRFFLLKHYITSDGFHSFNSKWK